MSLGFELSGGRLSSGRDADADAASSPRNDPGDGPSPSSLRPRPPRDVDPLRFGSLS